MTSHLPIEKVRGHVLGKKKKYVCLLSHAEKNKVRLVGNNFFLILFFITELMLDGI